VIYDPHLLPCLLQEELRVAAQQRRQQRAAHAQLPVAVAPRRRHNAGAEDGALRWVEALPGDVVLQTAGPHLGHGHLASQSAGIAGISDVFPAHFPWKLAVDVWKHADLR